MEFCFELNWAQVAQGRVWSVLVVEPIDVVDSSTGRMFVGLICLPGNLFGLVAFEKTFHWRVVIAVSFAAHALQAVAPE